MKRGKAWATTLACVALMQLSMADFLVASDARWHPIVAQSFVRDLGIGAEIYVELTSGEAVRGSIATIDERSFLVDLGQNRTFEVRYTRVEEVAVTRLSFDADVPDAVAARRVVMGLGEDEHVMVRTASDDEFRGRIREITSSSFKLIPDDQRDPIEIAYDDVLRVGKNLSKGATIAIVVGVVAAAVVIIAAATSEDGIY